MNKLIQRIREWLNPTSQTEQLKAQRNALCAAENTASTVTAYSDEDLEAVSAYWRGRYRKLLWFSSLLRLNRKLDMPYQMFWEGTKETVGNLFMSIMGLLAGILFLCYIVLYTMWLVFRGCFHGVFGTILREARKDADAMRIEFNARRIPGYRREHETPEERAARELELSKKQWTIIFSSKKTGRPCYACEYQNSSATLNDPGAAVIQAEQQAREKFVSWWKSRTHMDVPETNTIVRTGKREIEVVINDTNS